MECHGPLPDPVIRLPSVQLVGAQKSGTSAIADWLFGAGGFRRPKVFDGEPPYYSKEVHFFDIDHRYHKGPEFYGQRFYQQSDCRTLDATPDTLQFPKRVSETYKNAGGDQKEKLKIIVILREPIARELSLYNHLAHDCRFLDNLKRNQWHNQVMKKDADGVSRIMSFQQFVRNHSIPALQQKAKHGRSTRYSLYANHLSAWFQVFSRKQILVLAYEELCSQPEKLQQRIQSFLGYDIPGRIQRGSNSNENTYKVRAPSPSTRESLQAVFHTENEKLYQLLEAHPGPGAEQSPFPKFGGYAVVPAATVTRPPTTLGMQDPGRQEKRKSVQVEKRRRSVLPKLGEPPSSLDELARGSDKHSAFEDKAKHCAEKKARKTR